MLVPFCVKLCDTFQASEVLKRISVMSANQKKCLCVSWRDCYSARVSAVLLGLWWSVGQRRHRSGRQEKRQRINVNEWELYSLLLDVTARKSCSFSWTDYRWLGQRQTPHTKWVLKLHERPSAKWCSAVAWNASDHSGNTNVAWAIFTRFSVSDPEQAPRITLT